MSTHIGQRDLRNDSGSIMRALDRGEDFVVTRNGVPVGELRPVRSHFVTRELAVAAFRGAPPVEFERFREDLDDVVSQDIDPRA